MGEGRVGGRGVYWGPGRGLGGTAYGSTAALGEGRAADLLVYCTGLGRGVPGGCM